MVGLKTQEGVKFERFFSIIQREAQKQGAVFFADAGDGREFETPDMEGEDMMGWLIPQDLAAEFERLWRKSAPGEQWDDYYQWAVWSRSGEAVVVRFEQY